MSVPMEEVEETVTTTDGTYATEGDGIRPAVAMSAGDAIKTCFRKGMSSNLFTGRASRSEYNWYLLFSGVVQFAVFWMMIDEMMPTISESGDILYPDPSFPPFSQLILLVLFIPGIAVMVRRIHDLGFTGWIILLGVLPILGGIVTFILSLMCIFGAGKGHENKYGPVPTNIVESLKPVTIEAE